MGGLTPETHSSLEVTFTPYSRALVLWAGSAILGSTSFKGSTSTVRTLGKTARWHQSMPPSVGMQDSDSHVPLLDPGPHDPSGSPQKTGPGSHPPEVIVIYLWSSVLSALNIQAYPLFMGNECVSWDQPPCAYPDGHSRKMVSAEHTSSQDGVPSCQSFQLSWCWRPTLRRPTLLTVDKHVVGRLGGLLHKTP